MRLSGGKLVDGDTFRQLLRPAGEPIPAEATRIHGIDDAMVAAAPLFAEVWPRFKAFLGQAVVIGHTVGFDLAVLKRECELAGLPWTRPRTLDTRLLAQIAAPELAGYTLEKLADWLGVDVVDRHSALGDAMTTARVFLALVPKLRDHGIRTVAEAERACRALTAVLDDQARSGWIEAVEAPARADAEQTLGRFDSYAYRHRNRDIMRTPAVFVGSNVPVDEALGADGAAKDIGRCMCTGRHAASGGVRAAEAGIVTERDVLRAIDRLGAAALELPVGRIMSNAARLGSRRRVRLSRHRPNEPAQDPPSRCRRRGRPRGRRIVGARPAAPARRRGDIARRRDRRCGGRARAWRWPGRKLPRVAESLLAEGLSGRDVAEVISRELGALTRQAAVIAEQIMRERGQGDPPCRYAMIVLGSAGRGESLLAMDQDNAVIFERASRTARRIAGSRPWRRMSPISCMRPACPIARAGSWRRTRLARLGRDVAESNRPLDRARQPQGSAVRRYLLRLARRPRRRRSCRRGEAGCLCRGRGAGRVRKTPGRGRQHSPSLRFFGGIRTEGGRIDLKAAGLFGIVAAARAMAIRHHVMDHRPRPDGRREGDRSGQPDRSRCARGGAWGVSRSDRVAAG